GRARKERAVFMAASEWGEVHCSTEKFYARAIAPNHGNCTLRGAQPGFDSLRSRVRRTPLVRAKPEPFGGSLQQQRVLFLVHELVASTAHGHIRLGAAERVVESACRRFGRLIVERSPYHERRRSNPAGK